MNKKEEREVRLEHFSTSCGKIIIGRFVRVGNDLLLLFFFGCDAVVVAVQRIAGV